MRFRIVLIDDEKNIVEGLKVLIDWEALDCEIAGSAHDGRAGIELIRSLEPDIVISDIRMPQMTGLDMIRAVSEFSEARFIILSGYSDFEYAKTGISLGVTDYVLKPVDEDELIAAVRRACAEIGHRRQELRDRQNLEEECARAVACARDYLLRDFASGYFETDEEALRALDGIDLPFGDGWHTALYFQLSENAAVPDAEALRGELAALLEQTLQVACGVFRCAPHACAAVLTTPARLDPHALSAAANSVRYALCKRFGSPVTVGIGEPCGQICRIPQSCQQAQHALMYQIVRGENSVNAFSETLESAHFVTLVPQELWKNYKNSLSKLDSAAIGRAIDAIFDEIIQMRAMPLMGIQINSLNIVLTCISSLSELSASFSGVTPSGIAEIRGIYSIRSIETIQSLVKSVVAGLVAGSRAADSQMGLIPRVQAYLKENLCGEISLVSAAQEFHLSPVYLCQLFKKETGQLFTDYITGLKMDKAKELLAGRGMMVYEAAQELGYKDTKYFSRLFEKRTGMKPADFRKQEQP